MLDDDSIRLRAGLFFESMVNDGNFKVARRAPDLRIKARLCPEQTYAPEQHRNKEQMRAGR